MGALTSLEDGLNNLFGKQAPALPANGKKAIVQYLPWITLFIAVLTVWATYSLWHWANVANSYVDFANNLSQAYGGPAVAVERLTFMVWVSMGVLSVMAILYLLAFQPLKAHKKQGWDLLFYAMLVNIAYGLVSMFTDYGSFSNLLGTIIGSAIGFYFLFQIRESYLGSKKATPVKSSGKKIA